MNTWSLRLLVIGAINALIALALVAERGFATLYLGYLGVAIVVLAIGALWK
jgi:hypothetical protein